MKLMRLFWVALAAAGITTSTANASPIDAQPVTSGFMYIDSLSDFVTDSTTVAGSLTSGQNQARINVDLATASIMGESQHTGGPGFSHTNGQFWEFVTFHGATPTVDITYRFSTEGSLSRTSDEASSGEMISRVLMFDVTDVAQVFGDPESRSGIDKQSPVLSSETWTAPDLIGFNIAYRAALVNSEGVGILAPQASQYLDSVFSDTLGIDEPLIVDFSEELTVTVPTERLLLVGMLQLTGGIDDAHVDFFGTTRLEFTELNGATFTSESGVFMSSTDVPEPSSAALGLLGFVVIAVSRRRRNRGGTEKASGVSTRNLSR